MNESPDDDLADLLRGVARGEVPAFEALFRRARPLVASRARAIVGPSRAEDVVSEVFLQVWRTAPSFDERRGAPRAWLAQLTMARAIDLLRRERVQLPPHEDILDHDPVAVDGSPEDALSRSEVARCLAQAVAALPTRERMMATMHHWGELSHSEIVAVTGLPLGTVKSLLARGHKRLCKRLAAALALPVRASTAA